MTNHSSDPSGSSRYAARNSLLLARRLALMGSVAAGLGDAVFGFSSPTGALDFVSSPTHAQDSNAFGKAA